MSDENILFHCTDWLLFKLRFTLFYKSYKISLDVKRLNVLSDCVSVPFHASLSCLQLQIEMSHSHGQCCLAEMKGCTSLTEMSVWGKWTKIAQKYLKIRNRFMYQNFIFHLRTHQIYAVTLWRAPSHSLVSSALNKLYMRQLKLED